MPESDIKGLKVIHIDDEEPQRRMMTAMLTGMGCEVTSVDNSLDAPRIIREKMAMNPPGADIVLTDGTMPGMNGGELATWINTEFPSLPVVIVSGETADYLRAYPSAFRGSVSKPFRVNELRVGIQTARS